MNVYLKSVLSALAFSFLFYSKSMGINLFLVSAFVVTLLSLFQEKRAFPSVYAFAYIFTALMVFFDPTNFKVFVHLMAFLLYIGKNIAPKNSIYVTWFMGVVNMIIASIYHFNIYLKNPEERKKTLSPKVINALKGIVVAIVLLVVFSFLYQKANPLFSDIISQINIDFLSIPWLFFTLMGYFVFLHILRPYYPENLMALDKTQQNELKQSMPFSNLNLEKLEGEHTLGSIVFGVLNVLLLFFLVTDIVYLTEINTASNEDYSQSVHEGIYALIFSILCAIVIILYFFRGDLNFFEKNKTIKTLSYSWIALNLVLVLITWYKNYVYVEALGLTYKRIGVFVYLLLVIAGLCTTYIKVSQTKSFIYLVRTNIALLFCFLFASSVIPWDNAITQYNLNHLSNPDMNYLIHLGDTNSLQLKKYLLQNKHYNTSNYKKEIHLKSDRFLKDLNEKQWQEYSIYQFILK